MLLAGLTVDKCRNPPAMPMNVCRSRACCARGAQIKAADAGDWKGAERLEAKMKLKWEMR